MKHLNKKLIYIMMAFVVAMACVCVAFIKVNATAADVKSEQNALILNGTIKDTSGNILSSIEKIKFTSIIGGQSFEMDVINGNFEIINEESSMRGYWDVSSSTGYALSSNIVSYYEDSTITLTAYKIYNLNLSVNDLSLGSIKEGDREAPSSIRIVESLDTIKSEGNTLKAVGKSEYKFTAEAKDGAIFKYWDVKSADTNSNLGDTVTGNINAVANFEKTAPETLHIWGQVSNTSQESVSNATITLTTTKPEANTYTVKTNGTGSFTMEDLPQGVTGSFTINYDSGYVLEKSIDNLQESDDDFKIEAYHIYKLNLAVSDEELGHIQISGQEADAKHDIYESQSQVKTNGEDLVVTYKGVDTTYKAVAKDGATFKNWEVVASDTNSSLGDTVTGNLTAIANFEKKVDPTPDPDPKPTPTPDPDPTPTPEPTPASDDSPSSYDNGGSTSSSTGDGLPIPFIALGALGALGCAVVVKKKFI